MTTPKLTDTSQEEQNQSEWFEEFKDLIFLFMWHILLQWDIHLYYFSISLNLMIQIRTYKY